MHLALCESCQSPACSVRDDTPWCPCFATIETLHVDGCCSATFVHVCTPARTHHQWLIANVSTHYRCIALPSVIFAGPCHTLHRGSTRQTQLCALETPCTAGDTSVRVRTVLPYTAPCPPPHPTPSRFFVYGLVQVCGYRSVCCVVFDPLVWIPVSSTHVCPKDLLIRLLIRCAGRGGGGDE